jgi:hypothetical protein
MKSKYSFAFLCIIIIFSCKIFKSEFISFELIDSLLLIHECDDLKEIRKEDYLKIETLSVYDTKCKINEVISEFKNLQEISINSKKLNFSSIQIVFDSLKILNIYDSKLSDIPDFVFLQNNIERLAVGLKNESSIDSRISSFKQLKSLSLTFEDLREVPEELTNLVSLNEVFIFMSCDGVLNVPKEFSKLSKLETLAFPYDFSSGYQNLKAIPNIKELIVPKVKPINGNYEYLKNYTFLESIKITDITREEKFVLRKKFPKGLKLF